MSHNYPEYRDHLNEFAAKLPTGARKGFAALHQGTIKEGVLDVKTKELIALGIAIATRCDGCIAYHMNAATNAGVTREELDDMIGVAMLMGGGPSMVYGAQAIEAFEQYQAQK
jgi:AhpD family alkylhydroperoxidase